MTTILIVEDERRIASFVAKGLRAAGFVPEVYSTGAEAVEAALQGRGALMLLDVGLPDIDGFEVLERIRGQGSGMPVIMLTAAWREGPTTTSPSPSPSRSCWPACACGCARRRPRRGD